jgi:predicted ATP-grasp superfamily ATP-dependent carboligase
MRHGKLTVRAWWRSLHGKREAAWFQWSDPVPFLAMCIRLMLRVVERGFQSIRKQLSGPFRS